MRILQLTTYPLKNPLHGGQIRCNQIASQLRNAGHEVMSIAVFIQSDYPDFSSDDIPIDQSSIHWPKCIPELYDYFTGVYVENSDSAFMTINQKISSFDPSVLIVEHPWLFRVAKKCASPKTKIVYSSHNIEFRLKANATTGRESHLLLDQIKAVEETAVLDSDLTVTCTHADAEHYRRLKSRHGNDTATIVAGNGVEPFCVDSVAVAQLKNLFPRPYPIFVGSAHPPNAVGFWEMMAPGLTFLKPWEEVMILGGVSGILLNQSKFKEYEALNRNRLHMLGTRQKSELQQFIAASHLVMLPITLGEGSNLKTAEALESGRPIVGTSKAFRGYESAMDLPHVTIADTSHEFRLAVRSILDSPRYVDGTPASTRRQFHWDNQLRNMVCAIDDISSSSNLSTAQ